MSNTMRVVLNLSLFVMFLGCIASLINGNWAALLVILMSMMYVGSRHE